MDRVAAIDQLKSVWAILSSDLDCAREYGQTENTPYAQRALIRAFFAAVEGLSYQLRVVTLASLEKTEHLSIAEIALLREERYVLDRKGRPKASSSFLQFPESLLFSLSVYAKNHGATFEVDRDQPGWRAFLCATELRNHVTHPKSAASLNPTNEELQALMDASRWWLATLLSLFKVCDEADEYWRKKLGAPQ
jgi:hypothetical protein